MLNKVTLDKAAQLPVWRRPITLLVLLAVAMPIAFNVWYALLNNFVIGVAGFDGADIGLLHSVREIPGFVTVGVIALLLIIREQVMGVVSLIVMAVAIAVTAWFPSLTGLLVLTLISSTGFHIFEAVNQSLQLQWLDKTKASRVLGWLLAAGSASTLVAYVLLVLSWERFGLSYNFVYLLGGGVTVAIGVYCLVAFPQFEAPTPQARKMVLKRRYWLYYAMQFMAGARRQIFVVFAGFMMVERFGFEVHEITALYLINLVINMAVAPLVGGAVARFGERRTLIVEYAGLVIVFLAYGGVYFFGWGLVFACVLYVVDHMLFSLALALKTYFQKIADPEDIAPTTAVAFTINHTTAVFLPVALGLLWLVSPGAVFALAALMAAVSLGLATLIPRHPDKGNETRLAGRRVGAVG